MKRLALILVILLLFTFTHSKKQFNLGGLLGNNQANNPNYGNNSLQGVLNSLNGGQQPYTNQGFAPGVAGPNNQRARVDPGCQLSGCNQELCVSAGAQSTASPCIYKREFDCLKTSNAYCRNSNNSCSWVPNQQIDACVANARRQGN